MDGLTRGDIANLDRRRQCHGELVAITTTSRGLMVIIILALMMSLHSVSASSSTRTPIQHIVVIMQENHSFDNYFGTYPLANGTKVDSTTLRLRHVNGVQNHVCLPYHGSCVSLRLTAGPAQTGPAEGQRTYEMDYADNATGFATYSGPQSMIYYDYHSIPGYWDYAEEYGLGDNYFASVLSVTTPNRLVILTGDTPVSANNGPPPYVQYNDTLMAQMDSASVTWAYYEYIEPFSGPINTYPLNYLLNRPQLALADTRNISDLSRELVSGSGLPSVSFVNSLGAFDRTEHPPFDPAIGEQQTVSIVSQVMESRYWPTTAIFVTWDEGGGYYDHVQPPQEFVINHGFTKALRGLGQRVPLLVISPFSKQNFVSDALLSHLSLTHFIEYNWNLPPLNALVSRAILPLDFFDFSQVPRPPIILNSPIVYPIPLQTSSGKAVFALAIEYSFLVAVAAFTFVIVARRVIRTSRDHENRRSRSRIVQVGVG